MPSREKKQLSPFEKMSKSALKKFPPQLFNDNVVAIMANKLYTKSRFGGFKGHPV